MLRWTSVQDDEAGLDEVTIGLWVWRPTLVELQVCNILEQETMANQSKD